MGRSREKIPGLGVRIVKEVEIWKIRTRWAGGNGGL